MKKGMMALLMMLFLLVATPVLGAEVNLDEMSEVSAYGVDDHLYTYIKISDLFDVSTLIAEQTSPEILVKGTSVPVSIEQSNVKSRYVFLVDASGSMKKYIGIVHDYLDSLVENETQESVFSILTFGEKMHVVEENIPDKDRVKKIINGLKFEEEFTDPYTAIIDSLDYLKNSSWEGEEIINLVVVSDGKPDLRETTPDADAVNVRVSEATEKIASTPEIVVHTLGVEEWDETMSRAFSVNTGVNLTVDTKQAAKDAGLAMADFVDHLYQVSFELAQIPRTDTFEVGIKLEGKTVDETNAILRGSFSGVKVMLNEKEEAEKQEEIQKPSFEPVEETISPKPEIDEKTEFDRKQIAIICIAAFVVLILFFFGFFVIRRKNKSGKEKCTPQTPETLMRLEVISGECMNLKKEYIFTDEFLIGRHRKCDLVFRNKGMELYNTKIFWKGQMIYIEDLSSKNGTALNGMRLYAPNRLRSGDEITIGAVRFKLFF